MQHQYATIQVQGPLQSSFHTNYKPQATAFTTLAFRLDSPVTLVSLTSSPWLVGVFTSCGQAVLSVTSRSFHLYNCYPPGV